MNGYSLQILIKEPTCFKAENPTCIGLTLSNRYRSCQHTTIIETGLSDFHKLVVAILKTTYQKFGPTIVNYRDYRNCTEQTFKQDLRTEFQRIQAEDLDYKNFQNCFEKVLDNHTPMKRKYARANEEPFMNRALRKATMLRSRLQNRYNNSPTVELWEAFRKQRSLCVKLFRTEKETFSKS